MREFEFNQEAAVAAAEFEGMIGAKQHLPNLQIPEPNSTKIKTRILNEFNLTRDEQDRATGEGMPEARRT